MVALVLTAGSALKRVLEKFFEIREVPAGRPALQDFLELALWVAIFASAFVTSPMNAQGEPNAPADQWLQAHTGGGLCIWKRVTGVPCPGCGLSRGCVQVAHGHLVEAVKLNPLSPIMFFLMGARAIHVFIFCILKRDMKNRIPWWLAWKFYGALGAAFGVLGVYRVALRFM